MSVQLLDKARKINKLLHNYNSSKIVFSDICDVLSEILDSNVNEEKGDDVYLSRIKCKLYYALKRLKNGK